LAMQPKTLSRYFFQNTKIIFQISVWLTEETAAT
jgi:hypothetical protein